jgi:hypothetical protein
MGIYDKDDDGYLSGKELAKAVSDGVITVSPAGKISSVDHLQLHAHLDDYGDQNGSLTMEEFNEMRSLDPYGPPALTQQQFDALDFNHDGVTSTREFNNAGWYFGDKDGMLNHDEYLDMLQTLGMPIPSENEGANGETWWDAVSHDGVVDSSSMPGSRETAFTAPPEEEPNDVPVSY